MEIGVNHNGSIKLAKEMILSATKAGADVVKFQLYKTNELIVKNTSLAKYQKKIHHLSHNMRCYKNMN